MSPGIMALADRERLRALLAGAGFSDPLIEEIAFTWRFADAGDFWAFLTDAAGAIALVLRRFDAREQERVREEITQRVRPFATPDGIEFQAVSLVASGA